MVKKEYEELRKEHPILPSFESIDTEFEISSIEKTEFLLRKVKRKIAERLEPILDFLERSLMPDPNSLTDAYEFNCFTDGEKEEIFQMFRQLMDNYRLILETDLEGDDKKDVETIKKLYDLWKQNKGKIIGVVKKARQCWKKDVEVKEVLGYLG